MKHILLILSICLMSLTAQADFNHLRLEQKDWYLHSTPADLQQGIRKYIKLGETSENWTEILVIQHFADEEENTSLESFENIQKATIITACPTTSWTSLYVQNNERMWKYAYTNCPGQGDQTGLARAIKVPGEIQMIYYTLKQGSMSSDKESTWTNILKEYVIYETPAPQ